MRSNHEKVTLEAIGHVERQGLKPEFNVVFKNSAQAGRKPGRCRYQHPCAKALLRVGFRCAADE
jgi:hypothetical protein